MEWASVVTVTPEIRVALDTLHHVGVSFHPTDSHKLDCGCVVTVGWHTARYEPGIAVGACCPAHANAHERVIERWEDPEVVERMSDKLAVDSFAELLREEIER